ncbi:TPA: hypothetical protein PXR41_004540 [Yersinia enterocolitica]|nr:hypothetical protein [Yersinia enterocolitica]
MNNIEELREHCEEMIAISPLRYAYIPASSIITLIDRIVKAEAELSAANEKLSKAVLPPRVEGILKQWQFERDCEWIESIKAAGFTVEGE